jgi:hypothetical protein
MSYIIKSTSPFVSIKLTQAGRESLAKGQLNFASWAIGDSEINYDREAIVDANQTNPILSGSSKVFRPFDKQPDFKSFITTVSGNLFNPLSSANISVVKAVVNNEADTRGFFTGSSSVYTTLSGSPYMRGYTNPLNTSITGGSQLVISSAVTVNVGDFIRVKLTNNTVTGATALENEKPLPNLWFKVQATGVTSGGTLVTLDRNLPNNSAQNTSNSYVFVYPGGEVADAFGYDTATAYWDSGTLSFDSATNITCGDVKVWNQNNVWCENLAGVTGLTTTNLYEDYTKFGSYDYLGSKNPYFEYLCTSSDSSATSTECNGPGFSYPDTVSKSIGILHYTNNTISNLYGDFLYIDVANSKQVIVTLPDLMYHRRNFETGSGTSMGMLFVSSGVTKVLGTTNIEYMDLYEDPNYISDQNPQVVGKVFPQLKLVVIDNDEIVAATSYKANRNWTLPPLSAFLTAPSGGTTTGILDVNKTMYLTYALDNTSGVGLTTSLPCQSYIKVTNSSSSSKDVSFNISDVDLLPYMRKTEAAGYDGLGFFARQFKLVYQIVDDANTRPDPGAWKVYDYTSTLITTTTGQTIDPTLLENQSPSAIGFVLNGAVNSAATTFDITVPLSMATNASPSTLQFGDERFFYGNLDTFIGSTIYKTIFDIRVNAAQFTLTSNPTRSKQASTNPPDIKVTEVGIYDSNNNLVIVGKLSQPVALANGNTIMLELSMDF